MYKVIVFLIDALIFYSVPVFYYWHMNSYFGWNLKPSSDAEVIADGVLLLLVLLAIGIIKRREQ